MDKVWIVTSKLNNLAESHIEGVFDSYQLAHLASEDLWRKLEPPFDSYLWKYKEYSICETCEMLIWSTKTTRTREETPFAKIRIEPYPVWH